MISNEKLDWLKEFRQTCEDEMPTAVANHFTQLGVTGPTKFEVPEGYGLMDESTCDPEYNKAVWSILRETGMLQPVRVVLRRDLKVVKKHEEDSGWGHLYGRIVIKTYGRQLVDHFLTTYPSKDWMPVETRAA